MLALSTLLWRREVPAHEYVSRFRDKEKFTDVALDELAPVVDADAADNWVWCMESLNGDEIERLKDFVLAVWTFTVTSLSAYRGKKGLDPKTSIDQYEADDEDSWLPAWSQGCTGAAEEEVVARRLVVMKAKFRVEGDRRLYTAKPGAEPMDVTSAPVTACRACKTRPRVSVRREVGPACADVSRGGGSTCADVWRTGWSACADIWQMCNAVFFFPLCIFEHLTGERRITAPGPHTQLFGGARH